MPMECRRYRMLLALPSVLVLVFSLTIFLLVLLTLFAVVLMLTEEVVQLTVTFGTHTDLSV